MHEVVLDGGGHQEREDILILAVKQHRCVGFLPGEGEFSGTSGLGAALHY